MGVVNVTPDSFYDGGRHADAPNGDRARAPSGRGGRGPPRRRRASRAGRAPSPSPRRRSCARVLPVLDGLRDVGVPISVDTTKPEVMRAALDARRRDDQRHHRARAAGRARGRRARPTAAVCLMHMQGRPRTMQADPRLRRRRGRSARFPRGARAGLRSRGHRARAHRAGSRLRVRQDGRPQPRRCCAHLGEHRRARLPGARRLVAQVEPRADHRAAGRGPARGEPRRGASRGAARRENACGSTTWRRRATRSPYWRRSERPA